MGLALRIAIASTVLAAFAVHAGTLYKSIDRDGRVTFSDAPIEGAVSVQRIATSDSANPPESASAPQYLALADSFDEAVARANEKVDLAEHALALARSALLDDNPLTIAGPSLSRAERQQVEFFKRDVATARRNLMRVLKARNALTSQRPFA